MVKVNEIVNKIQGGSALWCYNEFNWKSRHVQKVKSRAPPLETNSCI